MDELMLDGNAIAGQAHAKEAGPPRRVRSCEVPEIAVVLAIPEDCPGNPKTLPARVMRQDGPSQLVERVKP
jgi:hypothetical protein